MTSGGQVQIVMRENPLIICHNTGQLPAKPASGKPYPAASFTALLDGALFHNSSLCLGVQHGGVSPG